MSELAHIGLDVHKKTIAVAALRPVTQPRARQDRPHRRP